MLNKSDLEKMVSKANGSRKARILDDGDVERFVDLVNEASDNQHTIRVYSSQGFVPNSYKYRADISCLEARRTEDGTFAINAFTVDAKRSHGNGSLVTINGRAAE